MADWMRRYLNPDCGHALEEYAHNIDGWVVATDSRCLLATHDWSGGLTRPAELLPQKELRALRKILAAEPTDEARVTTLGDLWLWLDRVERMACPACDTLRLRHTVTALGGQIDSWCSECDGAGWVFPSPDPVDADTVSFCGHPFDRNRLAWWLAAELGESHDSVTYWPSGIVVPFAYRAVYFVGDRWRLTVMGLKRDSHPGVYREYVPGAGLWWAARRGGAFAGADWFREHDLWDERQMWGDVPEPVGV